MSAKDLQRREIEERLVTVLAVAVTGKDEATRTKARAMAADLRALLADMDASAPLRRAGESAPG